MCERRLSFRALTITLQIRVCALCWLASPPYMRLGATFAVALAARSSTLRTGSAPTGSAGVQACPPPPMASREAVWLALRGKTLGRVGARRKRSASERHGWAPRLRTAHACSPHRGRSGPWALTKILVALRKKSKLVEARAVLGTSPVPGSYRGDAT
jgi:hypothetical protein